MDSAGVNLYAGRDRQASTREKADQSVAKGIDFNVISARPDHPEHLKDHESLPKADPQNAGAVAQAHTNKGCNRLAALPRSFGPAIMH